MYVTLVKLNFFDTWHVVFFVSFVNNEKLFVALSVLHVFKDVNSSPYTAKVFGNKMLLPLERWIDEVILPIVAIVTVVVVVVVAVNILWVMKYLQVELGCDARYVE
uniref:Uncharacterized protein n=1 Tax=Glossina brevipalpis TaxID=37001 RepID=A0A1A9X2B8_9MUSC